MGKAINKQFKVAVVSKGIKGRPSIPPDVVVLRVGNKKYSPQLNVRIGSKIMKDMNWRVGEMATLEVGTLDDGRLSLRIFSDEKGTHKLVGQSYQKGKMVCAWIKTADRSVMKMVMPLIDLFLPVQVCGRAIYVVQPEEV